MLMTTQPGLVAKPVSPWFVPVVVGPLDLAFTAARGRPRCTRPPQPARAAWRARSLGALFAVLFVIEHGYQIFR